MNFVNSVNLNTDLDIMISMIDDVMETASLSLQVSVSHSDLQIVANNDEEHGSEFIEVLKRQL